jgi:hypothetical protein
MKHTFGCDWGFVEGAPCTCGTSAAGYIQKVLSSMPKAPTSDAVLTKLAAIFDKLEEGTISAPEALLQFGRTIELDPVMLAAVEAELAAYKAYWARING